MALVDAVVEDLEANLVLPPHRTWRYLDPPMVRADQGAVLSVFVREMPTYEVVDTVGTYEQDDSLVVAFFLPSPRDIAAERDQAVAKQGLTIYEDLFDRLKLLTTGIPEIPALAEADVRRTRLGQIQGDLYLIEITLSVRRWNA